MNAEDHAREKTHRVYEVWVCPECRRQTHPHDGKCSKDVRPGQFRPSHMYVVEPVRVVSLDAVVQFLIADEKSRTAARVQAEFGEQS